MRITKIPLAFILRSTAIFFFLVCLATSGFAESKPFEPSNEDLVKGQIWHLVTAKFWKDPLENSAFDWKTADEFYHKLNNKHRSKDLDKLQQFVTDVKYEARKVSSKPVTPAQLRNIILLELAKTKTSDATSTEYKELEQKLKELLSESEMNADMGSDSTFTSPPKQSEKMVSQRHDESEVQSSLAPNEQDSSPLPFLIALASFGVGCTAGWALSYYKNKASNKAKDKAFNKLESKIQSLIRDGVNDENSRSNKLSGQNNGSASMSEVNNLTQQIQSLNNQVRMVALERDTALQQIKDLTRFTPPPPTPPTPLTPPIPQAEPAIIRYAPVLENNQIPDNQLTSEAMPHLPIMLTIKGVNPAQADYILNPQVNQGRIIGNGLNQLREFFDFTLPVGNFSSIRSAGPGTLLKTSEGWVVQTPAKLHVS